MKSNKQKKVLIALAGLGIAGGLGLSWYTSVNLNDKDSILPMVQNDTEKSDTAKKEEKPKKKPVHMNPMDGKEDSALFKNKKEMEHNAVVSSEREVRELFREFKFEKALDYLNELSDNYNFKGEAKVFEGLLNDGTLIANLEGDHGEEPNGLALLTLMNSFKDTETLLLATLSLDYNLRNYIFVSDGSLNPVFVEGNFPQILTKDTEEIPFEIGVMYPDTVAYHKVTFKLEGFNLDAYFIENKDGDVQIYTIEDVGKKSPYYTVAQWKKMKENISKGLPAMQGVLEMKTFEESLNKPVKEVEEKEKDKAPVKGETAEEPAEKK